MGKLLKIGGIVIGGIIVLVLLAVVLLVTFVDPNDYKNDIASLVKEKTGRELTIGGKIGFTFYPWLGFDIGKVSLSNAQGFSNRPFAKIEEAKVSVQIMPLLSHRLIVDTVILNGLDVSLERNKNGKTNWEDLSQPSAAVTPPKAGAPAPASEGGLKELAVKGVELKSANIVWDDRQTDTYYAVKDLNLDLGGMKPGKPVDFKASLVVQSKKPAITVAPKLSGTVTPDVSGQSYKVKGFKFSADIKGEGLSDKGANVSLTTNNVLFDMAHRNYAVDGMKLDATVHTAGASPRDISADLSVANVAADELKQAYAVKQLALNATVSGADIPGKEAKASVSADDITADLQKNTAHIPKLNMDLFGMKITGEIAASDLKTKQGFSGVLHVAEFSPRDVIKRIGSEAPKTADDQVLQKAKADVTFAGTANSLDVKSLSLLLDETTVTGKAALASFQPLATTFSINVDTINLDRYLPPPAKEEPAKEPAEKKPTKTAKPDFTALRKMSCNGEVSVGRLTANKLNLADVKARITAKNGVLAVSPATVNLYGGSVKADVSLDVSGDQPKVKVVSAVNKVQAGPLLKDMTGQDRVTGTANLKTDVTAQGANADAVKKTLNGTTAFDVTNGKIKGVNIAKMIRDAMAVLKGQPKSGDEPLETDFAELLGTLNMTNGLVKNDDLVLKSPLLRVNGKGQADMAKDDIDYLLTAALVGTLKGQGGQSLDQLKDIPIPIRVTGSLEKPSYTLDVKAMAQALATGALKEPAKNLEEQIRKKIFGGQSQESGTGTTEKKTSPLNPGDLLKGLIPGKR